MPGWMRCRGRFDELEECAFEDDDAVEPFTLTVFVRRPTQVEVSMDPDRLQKYQRMAASLRTLLAALSTITEDDRGEAAEKIDHDEWGIALQVIGALILDYKVTLDVPSKRLMRALMEEMGMNREEDDEYWFWAQMQPVIDESGMVR